MRFMWTRVLLFAALQVWWAIRRKSASFEKVFVVYPGTDADFKGYFPKWFRRFLPIVFPIGFVGKTCIVLATPFSTREFDATPERLREVKQTIKEIAKDLGTKSVALAGRLPSLMFRHGVALEHPFVQGTTGTVYACDSTLEAHIHESGLDASDITVGVLGVGHVGGKLIEHWQTNGFKAIVGYDILDRSGQFTDSRVTVSTDPRVLADVDFLVVLVEEGDQVMAVVPHLKKGCIVLDDTHPMMPRHVRQLLEQAGVRCFKVVVENGVRFTPRLPGYQRSWLPGCLIEAFVVAKNGGFRESKAKEFAQIANEVGLQPVRVEHRSTL